MLDTDADGDVVIELYWILNGKDIGAANRTHQRYHVACAARQWVHEHCPHERAVLVSDNNGFDAMWFNCWTDDAGIGLVFGYSSRRIGDFYAGTRRRWSDQSSWKSLRRTEHTHHPVDDVAGNMEALASILRAVNRPKVARFDR